MKMNILVLFEILLIYLEMPLLKMELIYILIYPNEGIFYLFLILFLFPHQLDHLMDFQLNYYLNLNHHYYFHNLNFLYLIEHLYFSLHYFHFHIL